MRKPLLMLLLAVVSSSAWAEWTEIGRIEDGTIYIDYASIRRSGNLAKVWWLTDFAKSSWSQKIQGQYDCKGKQSQVLAIARFTGRMGSGDILPESSHIPKWEPIQPGSIVETIFNIVCDKK
jgi:hypothetical protein